MNHQFTVEKLEEGLILPFNKPYGWTSFDLVNLVRKKLCQYVGIKKLKVGNLLPAVFIAILLASIIL